MNQALEKRLKRQVIGKQHRFLAVVPLGFEQTFIKEFEYIRQLHKASGTTNAAEHDRTELQTFERSERFDRLTDLNDRPKNSEKRENPQEYATEQPHVTGDGKVEFTTKLTEAWKVVAYSRVANRVLMHIADFKAENFRELEKKAAEIPWELYLLDDRLKTIDERRKTRDDRLGEALQTRDDNHLRRESRPTELGMTEPNGWDLNEAKGQRLETRGQRNNCNVIPSNAGDPVKFTNTLNIHVTCKHSRLYHSDAIAERLHKVISTSLPCEGGDHPSTQNLYVTFIDDRCTIWLDLAGEELYKRGHERFVNEAPLKETIAAAMLFEAYKTATLTTNHQPLTTLLDLMSGSGTFSLEAAYIANKIIPGICRDFALKHQPAFKEATWKFLIRQETTTMKGEYRDHACMGMIESNGWDLSEAKGQRRENGTPAAISKIITSDISERAISIIKHNVECSPLASITPSPIHPQIRDFFSYTAKEIAEACGDTSPILVLNPPYGKRLDFDAPKLYTKIGKKLTELSRELKAFNKALTVSILAPKDDTREGSKYTCTANLLHECPALAQNKNPTAKLIETSHGGFSLNALIAKI